MARFLTWLTDKTFPAYSPAGDVLGAFPFEYWTRDDSGKSVYSAGLAKLLGGDRVQNFGDLQARFQPGDAAALEGLYDRLRQHGTAFTLDAATADGERFIRIAGGRGPQGSALWFQDVTEVLYGQKTQQAASRNAQTELSIMTQALGAIPRPVWLRDRDQRITWCNDTYAEFLNTTREKVLEAQKEIAAQTLKKKAAERQRTPDGPLPGKTQARTALESGQPVETDVHVVVKGARMFLRITEIPLAAHTMTLGVAYNNTRVEELETELTRHQSSNRELLGQLRSAIAIYSADERLEFYNSAFAQLWTLEDQWLNSKPRLGEIMEKLRETRRLPEQTDFRRFKQSWLDMFTSLIEPRDDMLHLPDGTALRMLVVPHSMGGLMMTFEDVTSRLALESSYNTLIAVQKETLDNLAEAVAVYGGNGRLTLWNPSFARLWNLNPEDLADQPHITTLTDKLRLFFDEDEWPKQREDLIARGLTRAVHEGRLTRADGRLIDYSTVPLPDGGVLISYADVTDNVRVETALREKNAALETAEQLKLDFLANVSYQLRTPLNAIMGFTEILQNEYFGPLNTRQKQYTHDMQEASNALLGLINDILDLSTLEAGYMDLERQDTDMHALLQDVSSLVQSWCLKQGIDFALDVPADIGTLPVDARRVQQAVINLVRNAINFTPSGGRINVRASGTEKGMTIIVNDTGIGIPKQDSQRIFAPFERAQNAGAKGRNPRGGAGLGLTLVKNIVSLHGGTVSLESEPDKGTTVTLFLPYVYQKTRLKLARND